MEHLLQRVRPSPNQDVTFHETLGICYLFLAHIVF